MNLPELVQRLAQSYNPRGVSGGGTGMPVDLRAMNVLCQSSNIPKKNHQKISIPLKGHVTHQPGIWTPEGSLQLRFLETIDNHVHRILYAWQESMWEHDSGRGTIANVNNVNGSVAMDAVRLERLDTGDQPNCVYVLQWVFLSDYTWDQLNSESNVLGATVTFSYDDYYIDGWHARRPPVADPWPN